MQIVWICVCILIIVIMTVAFFHPWIVQKLLTRTIGRPGPWLLNGNKHYDEVARKLPQVMELQPGSVVVDITPDGYDVLARTLAVNEPDLRVHYIPNLEDLKSGIDAIVCYGGLVNETSPSEWPSKVGTIMEALKPGGWVWFGGILHPESKVPWYANWVPMNGQKLPIASWYEVPMRKNLVIVPHEEAFTTTIYKGLQSIFIQKK